MSSPASPDSNPKNPIAVLQKEIEAGEWDGCFELIGPPGIVTGERKAIIEKGKSKINIDKDVMSVWEEYKRKGENGEF
ncbi:uncharacterized protein EAE97_008968 [Botrytis byssoidea]|uniref:Uncharacterized protein n=1 Tax=Botrytis byssoidea TaxID=139641 RepID=A0A9P5IEG6_9HELO|nr:uncharacterized protein EAE97_008968 [Botrytis byssoidea]KAF7931947.1 hypothetical protein EAE97_008968 [Botrytis byssoidea]